MFGYYVDYMSCYREASLWIRAWIGAKMVYMGSLQFVDGSYAEWGNTAIFPDDNTPCVTLDRMDGSWVPEDCNSLSGYVCEIPKG